MKSMTGFAEESTKYNDLEFRCLIRSLNSRFLEINIKTPSFLKNSEGWIRDMIQAKILRGKIDIDLYLLVQYINMDNNNKQDQGFQH